MIEEGDAMTVRENVHQLIDELPEDHLAYVLDYLADLQDEDGTLGPETKRAIEEGLDDIALTLQQSDEIADYESNRERNGPVTTAL